MSEPTKQEGNFINVPNHHIYDRDDAALFLNPLLFAFNCTNSTEWCRYSTLTLKSSPHEDKKETQ
jgi:hypothetical protein